MVTRDDNQYFQIRESTLFTNKNYHTPEEKKQLISYFLQLEFFCVVGLN